MGPELRIAIGLEALFATLAPGMATMGVILTRDNFARTPVLPVLSPRATLELAQAGLDLMGVQTIGQVPVNRAEARRLARNGGIFRSGE